MRLIYGWIILICVIFFLVPPVASQQSNPTNPEVIEQMRTFQNTLTVIKRNYVQDVSSEKMIYRAIDSMLEELDPHSSFLDKKSAEKLAEEHRGSFGGLGIVITIKNDVLTVSALINDRTPGALAGLLPDDQIIKIDDKSTEGITTQEAANQMRGPKGTEVTITVKRKGIKEPIDFTIVRGDIPVDTVPYAYMIRPGIGYLRLERFTQKAHHEFVQYITELEKQGMESLILDLRNNPGGYLEQAFKIAGEFVGERKAIVETRGRMRGSSRKYQAPPAPAPRDYPVVVLVNQGSASASEIVAGALQDWDRGLVVGETTFGKGLVQRIFDSRSYPNPITACEGCKLKLTTARYYTPSGRCIQRPYEDIDTFTYRHPDREEIEEDESRPKYKTGRGRIVLGGGGIKPDIETEMDKMSRVTSILTSRNAFRLFTQHYYDNITPITELKAAPEITNQLQQQFLTFIKEKEIDVSQEDIAEDQKTVDRLLLRQLVLEYWSLKGVDYHKARQEAYKIYTELDTQLMKAIELAPQAEEILAQE